MELSGEPMNLLYRTLGGYTEHPNVASSLVVGLGCERCQVGGLFQHQGMVENQNLKTLVMQDSGGTSATIKAGIHASKFWLANRLLALVVIYSLLLGQAPNRADAFGFRGAQEGSAARSKS